MEPRRRNFFAASIVFLFAVFFGLMWYIMHVNDLIIFDNQWGNAVPKHTERAKSPEERLRAIATEAKVITGTIEQVTTLKSERIKFLRVRAFVIDWNRLSEVDVSAPSQELPMTEETFEVVVNEQTNIQNDGGLDAIRSGDFVSLETAENIYEAKRLTAVSLEKMGRDATSRSNKKTNQ